jgi:hypothetical protein
MPVHPALLSCVACALLPVALAAGQFRGPIPGEKAPPARKVMRETRVPVTVSGCLRRGSLQLADWPFKDNLAYVFNTDVVILDGSKDVLKQLRGEHNLHEDEITGIAIVQASPDGSTTTEVDSRPLAGGTLSASARESTGPTSELAQTVTIRVSSFRHLGDKCTTARMKAPQPSR